MKKQLLAVFAALVAVAFFGSSISLAAPKTKDAKKGRPGKTWDVGDSKEAPEYKTFRLCTKTINNVGISQFGDPLDPMKVLKLSGRSSDEQGIKNAALSMAIGYCTFLELTKLPEDLKAAGADDALVDKIMRGENVNQWLATAWQESCFDVARTTQSGYYQIDNPPYAVVDNMHWLYAGGNDWKQNPKFYYPFMDNFIKEPSLREMSGGTDYNSISNDPKKWYKGEKGRLPPLTTMDEKGFVWSSVEKGYYEAISYIRNKNGMQPYCNEKGEQEPAPAWKPYQGFSFAGWAVKYAKTVPETTYPYPVTVKGKTYNAPGNLQAYNSLGMVMAFMYNRGQFPFLNYYHQLTKQMIDDMKKGGQTQQQIDAAIAAADKVRKACQYITDAFGKSPDDVPALKDKCPYSRSDDGDPSDPLWWGGRYIWQLGWLNATLNECEEVYKENITLADMESVLNILKDFYGYEKGESEPRVKAGIGRAKELKWGYPYNSPETFENIMAVTKALMEKSRYPAEHREQWPEVKY